MVQMKHWMGVTAAVTMIVLASARAATASDVFGLSPLQWKLEADYAWATEVGSGEDKVSDGDSGILEYPAYPHFWEWSRIATGASHEYAIWDDGSVDELGYAEVTSSIMMRYDAGSNRAPAIGVAIYHDHDVPAYGDPGTQAISWAYSRMLDTVAFVPDESGPPHASLSGTNIVWQLALSGVSGHALDGYTGFFGDSTSASSWVKVGVSEAPERTDLVQRALDADLFQFYGTNGTSVQTHIQLTTPVGYIVAGTPGFVEDTLAGQMSAVLGVIFESRGTSGPALADFGNTMELTGITFSGGEYDGMTPEEAGFDVVFASGSSSPNPIPEPSILAIWSSLGLYAIAFGWRRRRRQ